MSKRNNEDACNDEKQIIKKLKSSSLNIWQTLARDELSCIFNLMSECDLINFAFCSTEMNQFIREWLLFHHPIAVEYSSEENWNISNVLKIRKSFQVDTMKVNGIFQKIADQYGGSLDVLTKKLFMICLNDNIPGLLKIPIKNIKSCYNKKISHVILKPNIGNMYEEEGESTAEERRIIEEKEYSEIPLGFTIKNLELGFERNVMDMYKTLRYCHLVENLTISFGDSIINETDIEIFECPILTSLKNLTFHFTCIIDDISAQKPIIDILKLAPNLKILDLFFNNYCDANILMYIARMCPNLEKLVCDVDQGYGAMGVTITDQELHSFLKALPKLRHLSISRAHQISGDFYSKIGEFPQLEYFRLPRGYRAETEDLEPETTTFKFGGGSLPNLTHLQVGEISLHDNDLKTLREMAPNLTNLGDIKCMW